MTLDVESGVKHQPINQSINRRGGGRLGPVICQVEGPSGKCD